MAARSLSTIPTSSPSQIRKIRWGGGAPPPAPPPGAPLRGADEKPIRGLCGRRGGSERNRSLDATKRHPARRPPPTAMPMTGNSGAPLEHLSSVTACKAVGLGAKLASRLGTSNQLLSSFVHVPHTAHGAWGRGARARGARSGGGPSWGPGFPTHPLAPSRRLVAQDGKGGLCAAQCCPY